MATSITLRDVTRALLLPSILAATLLIVDPAHAGDFAGRQIASNRIEKINGAAFKGELKSNTKEAIMFYKRGNHELDSKDYDSAIYSYKRSISLDSLFPLAYYNLGIAYVYIGEKESAAQNFATFVRLRPNAYNLKEVRELINVLRK